MSQYSLGYPTVIVRTTLPFRATAPLLRAAVRETDPTLPVFDLMTMDDGIGRSLGPFAVREETREIGLRMALGAGPERIRRDVLSRALSVIALGGAVGLLGALASSRVLAGLLFQVQPADPVALGAACLLLGLVALAAAYLPARRATRVDPAIALSE